MKTAVLISGHLRTFDRCLPTLHWHVFRHFPQLDFYVSTVQDADAPKAELLRAKYPGSRVEIEVVPKQPDCVAEMRSRGVTLPTEWVKGQPYTHEPYPISVHPQAVLRQLWQLDRCWGHFLFSNKLVRVNEGDAAALLGYDVVIRCRPDLWFHSCEIDTPLAPFPMPATVASTPRWGKFGGVNDRFAVLGTKAAEAYFTTYAQIPELAAAGCPIHPESLIKASLRRAGVEIQDDFAAEFSTLRATGELRAPEITTADLLPV